MKKILLLILISATIFSCKSDKKEQETINKDGEKVEMHGKGRHDPCVVPRAVPIVEAMAALVLADYLLINKTYS